MFVIGFRLGQLLTLDESLLLRPALIYAFAAPFGAPSRRPDRLAPNQCPNRVRVRRWQNAHREPAAALDFRVERQIAQRAIGDEILFRDRIPVDDELHRHFAGVADAGALDIPVRLFLITAAAAFGIGLPVQKCSRPDMHLDATGAERRSSLPFSPIRTSFTAKSSR